MKHLYFILIGIITILTAHAPVAHAQQDGQKWGLGIHAGMLTYYGDLSDNYLDPNREMRAPLDNREFIAQGLTLQRHISPAWSIRLSGIRGYFVANQRSIKWNGDLDTDRLDYRKALNVKTDILAGNLMLTYHFDNGWLLPKRGIVAPYLSVGAGYVDFSPKADLFRDGNRYYYWSDGTIRDSAEGNLGAVIVSQDGDYETDLAGLRTEGKDYDTWALQIPVGLGVKFRLSPWLSLNLESVVHYTFTDYLDDVSGNYLTDYDNALQQYAANPGGDLSSMRSQDRKPDNDLYAFTSLSLHFHLGKRKEKPYMPPIITTRPDSDYDTFMLEKIKPDTSQVSPAMPGEIIRIIEMPHAPQVTEGEETLPDAPKIQQMDSIIYEKKEEYAVDSLVSPSKGVEDSEAEEEVRVVEKVVVQEDTVDSLVTQSKDVEDSEAEEEEEIRVVEKVVEEKELVLEKLQGGEDTLAYRNEVDVVVNKDTLLHKYAERLEILEQKLAELDKAKTTSESSSGTEALRTEIQALRDEQRTWQMAMLEQRLQGLETENNRLRMEMQQQQYEQHLQMQQQQYEQQIQQMKEEIRRLRVSPAPSSGDVPPPSNPSSRPYVQKDEQAIARLEAEVEALERKLYQQRSVSPPANQSPTVIKIPEDNTAIITQLQRMEARIDELSKEKKADDNQQLMAEMAELRAMVEKQPTSDNRALEQQLLKSLETLRTDTASGRASAETRTALLLLQTELAGLKAQLSQQQEDNQALQQKLSEIKQEVARSPTPPDSKPNQELLDKIGQLEQKLAERPKEKIIVQAAAPSPRPYDSQAAAQEAIRGLENHNIFFTTNSSSIRDTYRERLDKIARVAMQHPSVHIQLRGYTDSVGNANANYLLSQRRAEAVATYLRRQGVSPDSISSYPSGQDNNPDKSFARRVELLLQVR